MSLSNKLTTETHLVNLALSKLGSSRVQINNLDTDNGEIFRQVDMFYFPVLEELVRMHSWQCCKKRNELAPYRLKLTPPDAVNAGSSFLTIATEATSQPINSTYTNYPKYDFNGGYASAVSDDNQGGTLSRTAGSETSSDDDKWQLSYYDASSSYTVTKTTNSLDPSGTYTHTSGDFIIEKIAPDFDWSCQHFIPPDAVRSFNVIPERNTNGFSRYKIDWVRQGDAILSNYNNAFLTYEGLPTVKQMDALFVSAFTTLLAARLATSLTGSRDLGLSLYNEFNNVIMPEARRVNGFEQNQPTEIDSAWLEATYTSNGLYSGSLPPFTKSSYGSFE